ncbi:MAG: zinc-binding dehydrogenase [Dehalococcoidia bacterium]|jgi:D-arabinose 1-dehydrogenase-like Zn-dependent alcohol dehydrogenase|nr:zinc-binding dehydrogenase [Dehalococcoidia bacterium]
MNGRLAVFQEPGKPFEIQERPLPPLEPGAILVKITLANICGSDLHMWRGHMKIATPGPWVLGHEMVGRVFAVGAGVESDSAGQPLDEGDRVVYSYYLPCMRCYNCLHGHTAACPNRFPSWWLSAVTPPHFNGAYGEYYYLAPGQAVFKIPDELSDDMVAPLNCALSQMVYSLHQVGVKWGDSVVIQGAGGLGIYASAIAKDMGADQVVVIDKFEERLKLASQCGADHLINLDELSSSKQRISRIRELTGGWGADVVVEVTGNPQAVAEGIPMVRQGGSYLWVGNINRGKTLEFDPSLLVNANRRVVGVATYEPWALQKALDFLKRTRGKYPFDHILSHKFTLDNINAAFEQADRGEVTRAAISMG